MPDPNKVRFAIEMKAERRATVMWSEEANSVDCEESNRRVDERREGERWEEGNKLVVEEDASRKEDIQTDQE